MCGIVGVVRRPSSRPVPDLRRLEADLEEARGRLAGHGRPRPETLEALSDAVALVEAVEVALRGVPGVRALVGDAAGARRLDAGAEALQGWVDELDAALDTDPAGTAMDLLGIAVVRARDALWALRRDRLRAAREVAELAGAGSTVKVAALEAFTSIQIVLSAIDRLEVRGRDSAGVHVLVHDHGLDLADPSTARTVAARAADPLFGSGSVRTPDGMLAFVYKAAAEIGELGDNTAVLRRQIADDVLLHAALADDGARAVVLGHTRWASVGIVSEANAHPLNHEEAARAGGPYVVAALNGDVDNHADLRAVEALELPAEITTDAKVIPTLVSRRLEQHGPGADALEDAFRSTVASLEGSVAVAASTAASPDALLLALRGSGQALYVGLAEDAFIVASEPYGLVEQTACYLRVDGETPADPERPGATRGQVVVLDGARAGTVEGIVRTAYDGTQLPVGADELAEAQITTRDVDRGDAPHFFLKEISEAPASFRKTLRGRIVEGSDGRLTALLGEEALPARTRAALADGAIRRIVVVGQGTAAVAGRSLATTLDAASAHRLLAEARPATELSGFGLRPDMADTLVIAISQSGTTTDTNRTVEVVRARGATVVSIVNRRNSDLVDRSDGVLYTSDGRDMEMSVASTKAFYSQIAAGFLLAVAVADAAGVLDAAWADDVLRGLRELPDAMQEVVRRRDAIAPLAVHALSRRSWAVVGNGPNAIAAHEVRIKLSELCYKAIPYDVTEDKKHIDLSSEPLVVVCAVGLDESVADDVAKEVAIYRAHKAAPLVVTTDDAAARYDAALGVIVVPPVAPALGFVLAAMAGHLFGYEAAQAIDGSARPLREARGAIEVALAGDPGRMLDRLAPALDAPARRFLDGLRAGEYDGSLEASTAVRIAALLRYATGSAGLDDYEAELGKVGTPSTVVDDLTNALTRGIDELTRPIDAIKHQAKTVTVGISRADETLLGVPLVAEVLAAGTPRDHLTYRTLRTLVDLDPAVLEITGFTRYRIEGDAAGEDASVAIVDRGGVSVSIPSRTDVDPRLTGTKHRVASQREVTVARGRRDDRTIVIVPEVKHNHAVGITLLHARFAEHLSADAMRGVLRGYQGRYAALKDAVTETEPVFDDARLAALGVVELLTEPVYVLAEHWRRT